MMLWMLRASRVARLPVGTPASRAAGEGTAWAGAAWAPKPLTDRWAVPAELAVLAPPPPQPASSRPVPESAAAMMSVAARGARRSARARAVVFMQLGRARCAAGSLPCTTNTSQRGADAQVNGRLRGRAAARRLGRVLLSGRPARRAA